MNNRYNQSGTGNRNRTWIILGIIFIVFLVIPGCVTYTSYNGLVQKEVTVEEQWAQVLVQYKRRADLIPNLVKIVEGAADFERSTLKEVVQARQAVNNLNIDASDISPDAIQQVEQAQSQLGGAMSRLLVTVERYPTLKATENFRTFQAQYEGTENRIANERRKFNKVVKDYNTYRRKFPQKIVAGMFGFEKREFYLSDASEEELEQLDEAPSVEFDL